MERLEREGKGLARLGWPTPMGMTPAETYAILDAGTPGAIDRAFVEAFEGNRREYFEKMVQDMIARKELRPWLVLINQSAAAYRQGAYAITVPALVTIIEGVLMHDKGSRIDVRRVVNERIAQHRTPEEFTAVLWRVLGEYVDELFKNSDFTGPKPTGLNRHWILHGRDVAEWGQADSLRLFLAADTVSSLAFPRALSLPVISTRRPTY